MQTGLPRKNNRELFHQPLHYLRSERSAHAKPPETIQGVYTVCVNKCRREGASLDVILTTKAQWQWREVSHMTGEVTRAVSADRQTHISSVSKQNITATMQVLLKTLSLFVMMPAKLIFSVTVNITKGNFNSSCRIIRLDLYKQVG